MNYRDSDITRLLKTIGHKKADRVPNFEIVIRERNVNAILGYEADKKASQLPPDEYVELATRIGMDAINVRLRWRLGWIDERTDYYVGGTVKGPKDLQSIKVPDLSTCSYVPGAQEPFLDRIDALVNAAADTKVGVCFVLGGPFSSAYLAMGLDHFMLALYDDPDFVNGLLDLMTDFGQAVVEEVCKHGIAFLIVADDMGLDSGLMIRPSLMQELWSPRIRKVLQPAKEKGLPVVLHSDGDIHQMLSSIAEVGFDGVHPLQPVGKLDIYEAKEKFGDRLCLFGNIDLSGVLSFGTPEEVAADVREHIERLADEGGYVCSSSHAILDSVPPENFSAMLDAVHRYGRY